MTTAPAPLFAGDWVTRNTDGARGRVRHIDPERGVLIRWDNPNDPATGWLDPATVTVAQTHAA